MSHFITIPAVVLVLVACVAAAPAQDKPTWWRISLKEDPAIAVGKSAIVAGAIGPKGAHLYVKGLEDSALMQITVVTHDPAVRLNVGVTKSDLKIYLK
ncbi:MAG: hypothetical protein CMJ83_06535, partial [Planctomycetes bacterium]|nr:hypothetical protein [Planctomycetota bacterium]